LRRGAHALCKRVQESVSLKTARDTLVPLELAQHAQMVYTQRS